MDSWRIRAARTFPFVLHAGALAAQTDSRFLDFAVAVAPATLGMTRLGESPSLCSL
jgi:hypothetical protein